MFEIKPPQSFCFFQVGDRNFICFFNYSMCRNYNCFRFSSPIPKSKKPVMCLIVKSSKLPNFTVQLFEQLFITRHLSFFDVKVNLHPRLFIKAV